MQTYGFFDAEELLDGSYDREYVAKQWADYFALFIGNGVFVSPTNQLAVRVVSGMKVKVLPGWAFINGHWYHNDEDLEITIPTNTTANPIHYGIYVHLDLSARTIEIVKGEAGQFNPIRNLTVYELKIADIEVGAGVVSLSQSVIEDTRADSSVCGFVTGVVDVISSTDLFAQFQSLFDEFMADTDEELTTWQTGVESDVSTWETQIQGSIETWFSGISGRLTQEVAVDLQNQIDAIKDIYVQNHILYLPNTAASVSNGVLTIGTD